MENLKTIIGNYMSTRPEYYSGRGATLSDLNSKILEGIYLGIEKQFGDNAAENYVKMVDGIKVLSATTFLNELYALFYADWKYKAKDKNENGIEIHKNKDGEYDETHGMISMLNAMNNRSDETKQIKGYFCISHGIKPKHLFETISGDGYIREHY